MSYRYLEDLRGNHTKEEIWVIGAGPSLDQFPLDFFKEKVCIGVNWVFSVFIDTGDGQEKFGTRTFYSVNSHAEPAYWIAKHRSEFLKNCFFISHPTSMRTYRGRHYCCPEDFNEDPYWIRNSADIDAVKASDTDFATMAKCLMTGRNDCRYFCRGTSLHWAIEVAVVLGAKKIYAVGAEGGTGYMRKHGSMYSQGAKYKFSHPHWATGTRALAKAFEPYGIEIVKYYYGTGEQSCEPK